VSKRANQSTNRSDNLGCMPDCECIYFYLYKIQNDTPRSYCKSKYERM